MKNIPLLLCTVLLVCLTVLPRGVYAAEPVSSRVSQRLYSTLAWGDRSAMVDAIVYLRDNLDLAAVESGLRLSGAGKKKRHSEVVGALMASAGRTQEQLSALLDQARESGDVEYYRPFWINNSILVRGRASLLIAISGREDVEFITHDRVLLRSGPTERASSAFSVPHPDTLRRRSYPIRSLGLETIWDRGLTGKGILVCAIGSGIDGRHQLLSPKWRGNNGGTSEESWFDPVDGSTYPFDDEPNTPSHGTGVMGIMVAGERSLGVAWEAQWIGAKIFDNENLTDDGRSSTKDSWMIQAFQWAADPDGNPETVVDVPDVINNSWGTTGEYNEDICRQVLWRLIDRVEATGTVVVFSAGNEGPEPWTTGSPASRAVSPLNAFAVGSVDSTGFVSPFSSRGPSACDSLSVKPNICGPGEDVVTIRGSEYVTGFQYVDGTSFSAPYVSGIAALIKQANPDLTADQIKQLILDTATDYGNPGPDYAYGWGVIDPVKIFDTLTVPDHPLLYSKRVEIEDAQGGNGNGFIEQGETIRLTVPVFNSGTAIGGLEGVARTSHPGVTVHDSTAFFGEIEQFGGTDNSSDPFVIEVMPDAEAGSQLVVYLELESPSGYSQTLQLSLPVAPAVEGMVRHDAGSFVLSITNYGQFGGHIGRTGAGESLRYPKDSPYSILHRGAVVMGTSSLRVSDGIKDFDFIPGPGGPIKVIEDSPRADQMTVGYTREKSEGSLNAIGVRLKQTTMTWSESPDNDYVIFEYDIENPHPSTINNFYLGLYADWDIPDSIPSRNAVGWNGSMNLGYVYNASGSGFPYGGLALVSDHQVSGHRAISNWRYIHEGYSDNVMYAFLSGGTANAASDSLDDWSQVLATGPHSIGPGENLTVAFALVVGDDLADLTVNANSARQKYSATLSLAGRSEEPEGPQQPALPRAFSLEQNTPNPFNPSTTISYTLPEGPPHRVRLVVYDLRGRRIATLVDREQDGGAYSVNWNGRNERGSPVSSGVYFYRLQAGEHTAVRKMVVVK